MAIPKALILLTTASWLSAPAFSSSIFYISNQYSNTIVTTTSGGTSVTVFASGLNAPNGLALDASGNLYEADKGSGNLYKFTPSGARTTVATGLNYPEGVAIDSSGNVYVSEAGNGNIDKISGGVLTLFASLPAASAPSALAFDSNGNLYAAGFNTDVIYKITPGGAFTTFATGLDEPQALAFNSSGILFESNWGTGAINEITSSGVTNSGFTGPLFQPWGLAFDSSGNLYAGDLRDNQIAEFSPSYSEFVGSVLNGPISIAIEATPEPSTWLAITTGIGILAFFRFRS